MKRVRLALVMLLTAAFLVACGSKETVTVCEYPEDNDSYKVWKTEFNAKGDTIDSYVWTVAFEDLDVEDITNEEEVKSKLAVLVNAKNFVDNDFRTVSYNISGGNYEISINYKGLAEATEDDLKSVGLDEDTISLSKRVAMFEENEAITCSTK